MQYHFMVMYDDGTKSWSVDQDTLRSVMPDGTMYDKNVFPGWSWPEEGSAEEAIDLALFRTLQYHIDTIPIPLEA